jgi:hypothetical protein
MYRLVQSGKIASGGCSAGQGSLEPVAPRIYLFLRILFHIPSELPRYGGIQSGGINISKSCGIKETVISTVIRMH